MYPVLQVGIGHQADDDEVNEGERHRNLNDEGLAQADSIGNHSVPPPHVDVTQVGAARSYLRNLSHGLNCVPLVYAGIVRSRARRVELRVGLIHSINLRNILLEVNLPATGTPLLNIGLAHGYEYYSQF